MRLPLLLTGFLNAEPNGTVNYTLATYIMNHMRQMDDMSVGELSEQCKVSRASVSRFCRALGYRDFYEMKRDFSTMLEEETAVTLDAGQTDRQYVQEVGQLAQELLRTVPAEQIDRLAAAILRYDNIVLMGHNQSGDSALMLQHDLIAQVHKSTQAIFRPREQQQFFEDVDAPALVIVFSVSGNFFSTLYSVNRVPKLPAGSLLCLLTANCPRQAPAGVGLHLDCGTGPGFSGGNMSLLLLEKLLVLHCCRANGAGSR